MRKILNRYADELMSLEVLGWYNEALRIRGILAPARVSRNDRLYLPEELRKMAEEVKGKEIPVYWEHISAQNAVGKARVYWDDVNKVLRYEAEIFDESAADKIRSGLVKHVSLGADYETMDLIDDVIIPRNLHLREISLVAVPGIPESNIEIIENLIELKAVERAVEVHETPKAPLDRPWDKVRAVDSLKRWAGGNGEIDWAKFRLGFAWYDEENPKTLRSYKLPHHEVINGKLMVVWRGVAAAMAALFGARGGVDIPDEDRPSVYKHLAAHYRQFEKEPPSYEKLSRLSRLDEPAKTIKILEAVGLSDEAYKALSELVVENAKYTVQHSGVCEMEMGGESRKIIVERIDGEPKTFEELCKKIGKRIAESVKLKAREAVTGTSDQPMTHSMPLFRIPAGAPIGLRGLGEIVALERGEKT
ncbi:MAG: hypothetical protein DRN68_06855, partial [Thaumarchaeota archaeon]